MYATHRNQAGFLLLSLCASIGTLYTHSTYAAVVDLLPSQNQPIFSPMTALTIGSMNAHYLGSYVGSRQQNAQEFTDKEQSLTLSHNNLLGQTPYILVTSLGYREIDYRQENPSYRESNAGIYDLRLAGGFWPWVDQVNKHYLGLAVVSTIPTGSYDQDKSINIGENRYRLSGIVNFKYQLLPHWYSESFFLYNWISDNPHYKASATQIGTLSQEPSMSWTTYLAYQSPQHWQAYVGLEQVIDTDSTLDNSLFKKGQHDFRGYLGGILPINAHNILQVRYGQTLDIETGYKQEHQLILKVSHLW